MSTSPVPHPTSSRSGRISSGPARDDGLLNRTLGFMREQLPVWRDDPQRPKKVAEKGLNSSLCDFLDVQARTLLPMARFKHEAPQSATRTVDLAVHGTAEMTLVHAQTYSIYEPFLVIEAKRLPAPRGTGREREYVSGFDPKNKSPTGGIQRFKVGVHGGQLETAAIIGYVEQHTLSHWHQTINSWITDLMSNSSKDECIWGSEDTLHELSTDKDAQFGSTHSNHARSANSISPQIRIEHLWILMNPVASLGASQQ